MADTIDEDFKAFCDELKKGTPDIDTIRAGVQKYGFKHLSDSQKAMFQFMPELVRNVFANNPVSIIFVTALILDLFLPREKKNIDEETIEQS